MFARLIANNPSRYEQQVHRITGKDPGRTASKIEALVGPAIADKKAASVVLVFPDLTTLEALARTMLALNSIAGWTVTCSKLHPPPSGNFTVFNVVREIPYGRRKCPSEALVFGPYAPFPPTRKAPVTALEIFVGKPMPKGPLDDVPTTRANLAHMKLNLPNHAIFLKMWKSSHDGRTQSLKGKADNRAKAKVSLVIPSALARQLGCQR